MATSFPFNSTTPVNSDGFAFNIAQLRTEILEESAITTTLARIRGFGKEDIIVTFVLDLSGPEVTALNAVVAAHVPLDSEPRLSIGYPSNQLIFRPGRPILSDGPTVFTDWASLVARLDEFKNFSRRQILIDDSFITPVEIPAGVYDLSDTTLEGISEVSKAALTLLDGVSFTEGPVEFIRLDVTHEGNSTPLDRSSDSIDVWLNCSVTCVNSPIISFSGSITSKLVLGGLTSVANGGNTAIALTDSNANLELVVAGDASISNDTLEDTVTSNPIALRAFGSSNISATQPSLNNTTIATTGSSSYVPVVQGNASSFEPSPTVTPLVSTDVQAALEEIDANVFAKVFGNSFANATNDVPVITTSTTFISYLTLNAVGVEAGLYRIHLWYVWNHDSIANDFEARVTLDGGSLTSEDPYHKQEPKDSIGTDPSGSTQRYVASVTKYANLTAGNHTVDLQFRTDSGNDEYTIFEAIIELWRVQ